MCRILYHFKDLKQASKSLILNEIIFQSKQARLLPVYQEVRQKHSDHSHLIQFGHNTSSKEQKISKSGYRGAQILLWYKVRKNIETMVLPLLSEKTKTKTKKVLKKYEQRENQRSINSPVQHLEGYRLEAKYFLKFHLCS